MVRRAGHRARAATPRAGCRERRLSAASDGEIGRHLGEGVRLQVCSLGSRSLDLVDDRPQPAKVRSLALPKTRVSQLRM